MTKIDVDAFFVVHSLFVGVIAVYFPSSFVVFSFFSGWWVSINKRFASVRRMNLGHMILTFAGNNTNIVEKKAQKSDFVCVTTVTFDKQMAVLYSRFFRV